MGLLSQLARKKTEYEDSDTKLHKVLDLFDLVGLGVGSTLGLGAYVLAGSNAKLSAGPAVTISFLIAAIASGAAGLCYAEFAARVPKAGSAYVYSYVTIGEFVAFVIGWNLLLEYIIGTASVATGFTNYLDSLVNNSISNTLTEWFPMHVSFLSEYPDFVSFFLVILVTGLLAFGVKESSRFTNYFTALNLITISIVLVGGGINADFSNWNIDINKNNTGFNYTTDGTGGFFPFGFDGVMTGAAHVFYGFVGFDAIATTGEEAKNPKRDIPIAIIISLFIIFFAYFGVSSVLTLALPYYLQDTNAPLPHLFEYLNMPVLKIIVTVGAMFALSTSLLGSMFPLPRVLYAMGSDGIIYKVFAKVSPRFKTPAIGTIISGLLAGIMAALFDSNELQDMMSIGTLLAYSIVAICVLVLRYEPNAVNKKYLSNLEMTDKDFEVFSLFKLLFNLNNNKEPNLITSALTKWAISMFGILSLIVCVFLMPLKDQLIPSRPEIFIPFIVFTTLLLTTIIIIARQPVDDTKLSFRVPLVPIVPCISVFMNAYLMFRLSLSTWIRLLIWLAIGFTIYFTYGLSHSEEGKGRKKAKEAQQNERNSNGVNISRF